MCERLDVKLWGDRCSSARIEGALLVSGSDVSSSIALLVPLRHDVTCIFTLVGSSYLSRGHYQCGVSKAELCSPVREQSDVGLVLDPLEPRWQ